MTKAEIEQQVHSVCRVRRFSIHTEQTYLGWIRRYSAHVASHADLTREEKLRTWLEHMAPHCSASTQNQALNAIIFLYRDVLQKPLGTIGKWARAKRPKIKPLPTKRKSPSAPTQEPRASSYPASSY